MSPCKVRTALGGSHRGMRIDSEVPVGGFESHVGAGGVEGVEVDVDVLACPDGPVTAQDSTCTLRTFGHAPSPFGRVTRDGAAGGWGPRLPGRVPPPRGGPSRPPSHFFCITPPLRLSLRQSLQPFEPPCPISTTSLPPFLRLGLWHRSVPSSVPPSIPPTPSASFSPSLPQIRALT